MKINSDHSHSYDGKLPIITGAKSMTFNYILIKQYPVPVTKNIQYSILLS